MPCRGLSVSLCALVTLLAAACGGDDGGDPTPQPDPLVAQVEDLFPAGAAREEARTLAGGVTSAADGGDAATAGARALDLAELTMAEFYAGRLAPAEAQQPAAIDRLLTDAFATAELGDPGLEPASFSDEGLVAVVRGAGGTFVTATLRAGLTIPGGAAPRAALLTLRRLPDSSAFAPGRGPLPTSLDQYPLFYDVSFTPEIELTSDAILGLCQFADPASAYYPQDAVFARLQLAHPDPADRSRIALLERAEAPFLDCDGTTGSLQAGDPTPASLLALRRVGIGGRVRKFSPFAAVEPPVGTATLTVTRAGTGSGTVTSAPAGIACGADCSEPFAAGTQVTLTAAPASGSAFTGWSGGGCTGTGTCVLTVTAATTVTATFAPSVPAVQVTTASLPNGTVNAAYSATLAATGGTGTYTWGVATGALPAGLALGAATGAITGTPTAAGTATFTVRATSGAQQGERQLSITVAQQGGIVFTTIGAGNNHACALAGTTAYCWGSNFNGQLGAGSTSSLSQFQPQLVAGGLQFSSLAVGASHTCALTTAGTAYCWGIRAQGQFGDGIVAPSPVVAPTIGAGGQAFVSLVAGVEHTCGLSASGSAFCWGTNSGSRSGQLGDGTSVDRLAPVPVNGGHVFTQLSAGSSSTCGLRADGAVLCWGSNSSGQLGNGSTATSSLVPVVVSGGRTYTRLAEVSASSTRCAIETGGALWCWGDNAVGQIGDGTTGSEPRREPVRVAAGTSFSAVANGATHTCALSTAGAAFCWGRGSSGQLGNGGQLDSPTPVPVSGGLVFSSIKVGLSHTCAIGGTAPIRAYCWGNNQFATVGVPTSIAIAVVPTAVTQP